MTEVSPEWLRQLLALQARVLSEAGPRDPADAAYLFGQTSDNEQSVLDTGADLAAAGRAARVLVSGADRGPGYAGGPAWLSALGRRGVSTDRLGTVAYIDPVPLNTLTEARALIRHVREEGMDRVLVVASPFHQLRAFMTAVSVVLDERVAVRLYSRPGQPLCWNETVRHSQGREMARRSDLLASERERIERYAEQGDLAPPAAILAWLDRRDAVGP